QMYPKWLVFLIWGAFLLQIASQKCFFEDLGRIFEIRDIFHRLRISNCHFHRHLRYSYPLSVSQTGLFLGFCDIQYSWYHKIAKTT
ncbi:MAG: hypothetical protein IJK83_08405, partial [Clostridiales bacterium]|nr:hypothetical protein [Clostridiales bacterium]